VRGYDGKATPSLGILTAPLQLTSDQGITTDATPTRSFTTADLQGEDVILGLPWLESVNPDICWATRSIRVPNKGSSITHTLAPVPISSPTIKSTESTNPSSNDAAADELQRTIADFLSTMTEEFYPDLSSTMSLIDTNTRKSKTTSTEPDLTAMGKQLFTTYDDVFPDQLPPGLPPARSVDHHIELKPGSKPACRQAFRQSQADDEAINKEVERGLAMGIMRPSQSAFSSLAFQVPKKPGDPEKRVVVDYRALNDITVKSKYPLPRTDELFDRLQGARYFSKLDLRTGFHQIRLAPEDTHKTAFRTSKGLFEYLVLAMGLCNAPGTFMQLMNETFSDLLYKGVLVFLDDIIIYSDTLEEHTELLNKVLQRLRTHKLYAKQSKCALYQQEVDFLGHYVGQHGLRVMEDKVEAVTDWPTPRNVRDVRAFLGLVGFYRRFIRNFSAIALPLSQLTRTVTGSPFEWGDKQQKSFDQLKRALQTAPILILPDPTKPYVLHTDASGFAIGAVLQQDQGNGLQPIAFLSKKMNEAETRYPVHEQELLSIVHSLKSFRHYLMGNQFTVKTDHKSLIHFQTQPMLSGRQVRWTQFLADYDFKIEYVQGKTNIVADAVSRRIDHLDPNTPSERPPVFIDPVNTTVIKSTTCTELLSSHIFTHTSDQLAATLNEIRVREDRRIELKRQQDRQKAIDAATKCHPPSPSNPPPDKHGVINMPSQRCTADKKSGGQCCLRTKKGQYCWNHTRTIEGLRIKASTVPGAGLGLFATKQFRSGDAITPYSGDIIALRHDRVGGPYYLQLNQHKGIDAARTNTASGRYANDPRGTQSPPNATLVLDTNRGTGRVKATRTIQPGQEIFVSYGPGYWRGHRPVANSITTAESNTDLDTTNDQHTLLHTILSTFQSPIMDEIQTAIKSDAEYGKQLQTRHANSGQLHSANGILYYNHRVCVPDNLALKTKIMQECHDAATSGHLGRDKTIEQIKRRFYWTAMDDDITKYVSSCDTCQRTKSDQPLTPGLLKPMPIPPFCWHTVGHDLITGLPKSRAGNDAIYVVVDKLSRQVHYIACRTAISAPELARLFFHHVIRLHGVPINIISDRDPRFTASFWQTLIAMMGSKLLMSTSFHPQTDGQTENSNKQLEQILRSVVNFNQDDWDEHLAAAEMANNNSKNATTGYTPYYLNMGREAIMPMDTAIDQPSSPNSTAVDAAQKWKAALQHAKQNIERTQQSQSKYADQHRRDTTFKVGDKVMLSQQNIQLLGDAHRTRKLSTRFLGPYTVKRVINDNAYELDLPPSFRIHPVINISQLKPYHDGAKEFPHRSPAPSRPPPVTAHPTMASESEWEAEEILDSRIERNKTKYLVKWAGYPREESTWEPIANLNNSKRLIKEYIKKNSVRINQQIEQLSRQLRSRRPPQ